MKNFKTKLFCLLVISTLIFPLFLFQSPYPVAEAAYGGDPDQWRYELDNSVGIGSGVSSYDELVFTGDTSGNVYCFNSVDNTLNWTVTLPRPILRTPTVQYDVLVINADPQYIGLDPYTGSLIFNYTSEIEIIAGGPKDVDHFDNIQPILSPDGNILYIRDYRTNNTYAGNYMGLHGRVLAINLTETDYYQQYIWYFGTLYGISGETNFINTLTYSNDVLYFGTDSYNGTVYGRIGALNATTGESLWNSTLDNRLFNALVDEEEGIVYFTSSSKNYAIDITDGSIIWQNTINTRQYTIMGLSPSFYNIENFISGNYYYTYIGGSYENGLACYNKLTGVSVWNVSLRQYLYTQIFGYENCLFFGDKYGKFYCLNATDGSSIWSFLSPLNTEYPNNSFVTYSSCVASNNIYFIAQNIIYSFNYLSGPKTFELTLIGDIQELYFYDNFESGADKWVNSGDWSSSEIQDTEVYNGQYSLYVSDYDEPRTLPFTSAISNFTFEISVKFDSTEFFYFYSIDIAENWYILDLTYHPPDNYFYLWLDNYDFENYLGIIDGEWVLSDDDSVFTTSLDSYLAEWLNFTFVFVPDDTTHTVSLYVDDVFVDTVLIDNELHNIEILGLFGIAYVDDIYLYGPDDEAVKTVNVWEQSPTYITTDPSFTGWLVNDELVSTDPIYTLDVEDDEITIEITTSEVSNSVLQLPFDNETSTVAYDWSIRNNNGAITGASRTYDGYYGMSLAFDGNDYVTVIDDSTLDPTSTFMFSAQIKPTSFTDGTLIDKPSAYGVYTTSDGKLKVMINDDYFTTSASVLTLNQWNHVWVVYTGYDVAIYVNNIEKLLASYTETIYSSPYDLIIGYEFIGNIDEVQFFSGIYSDNPLLPIATYPYVYGGFIDTTACSWVVASLSYNFTGSYIRQDSTDPITYAEFNFTDGTDVIGLSYTASTGSYTTSGNDKVSFVSYNSIQSYNALLLYGRIRIESTIASSQNIDLNLYCTTATSSDSLIIDNRFAIYGLGGVTSTTVVGDGALIAGGSVFDIMAQNSSLTEGGSSILVSTVAPNFQHLHTLTHLYQSAQWDEVNGVWDCPSFCSETGYLEFGVDYMEENCTWLNGWKTRIYIVDGGAGTGAWFANDQSWVRLNVTWWNNNELIKYDDVYAFYEAYDKNDTTTQISLYIDLWISEDEYSSNVAGHVSSQYYGMEEGGWWLWSNWQPVGSLQTSSTFYDNLYDGDGNLTSASTLKMFNVWSKITKTGVGEGDTSCDEHLWASINEVVQIKQLPYNVELVGIASPIFMPTTTPDTPLGFFASIGNTLANALDSIYYAIATLSQGALTLTSSVLDSVFGIFGITGFTASITSLIGGFATYFTQSITYVSSLIISIFTLFSSIALFIIEWIGRVISTLIQIGDLVVGILNGTGAITTGIGNIWEWIQIDTWFSIIPIVMVIYWFNSIDQRAKQTGGGWMSILMGDINSIISVISFIFDFAWRVISTVIDLSMRFINVFI